MNFPMKISLIAAVSAAMLGLSGAVWADGGRHYDGYGRYDKHHSGHYKHYNRHYESRRHYHSHDDDDSEELFIGLLMGGLVGYAIGGAQHADVPRYDSYPPASSAPPVAYPPQVVYPAPQTGYDGNHSCLQEREYQTRVMIGGRQVDAYGTACLQPDGSWRRGPAQVAAY